MILRIFIVTLWTAWALSGCGGSPSSEPGETEGGASTRMESLAAYQNLASSLAADAPSWAPAGKLPKGLYDNGAAVWNGYLYVSGGFGPGPEVNTSEVYIFRIHPDHQVVLHAVAHIPRKTLVFPKGERAVVTGIDGHRMFAANGRIYLVGGKFQYVRTDCYPPTENPCFTPTPTAWNRAILHASVQADGTLGGWEETPLPDGVGPYTPAVVVHEDGVIIIGGWDGEKNTATVVSAPLLADGRFGPWQESPPLPEGLSKHAAAASGSFLYVLGGNTGQSSGTAWSQEFRDRVYYAPIHLDHTVGEWRMANPLPGTRIDHQAAVLDDRLLVLGGRDVNEYFEDFTGGFYDYTMYRTVLAAAIGPEGALGPWEALNDLPTPLVRFAAAPAPDGLYLAGGSSGQLIDEIFCVSGICSAPYVREKGIYFLEGEHR